MAGIDKTYIDGKEYPIYRQWWIEYYDKMVKELGSAIWLYTFSIFNEFDIEITPDYLNKNDADLKEYKYALDFPIWNTSEKVDKWLIKNCDIASFRERMLDVYDHKWKGFNNQTWIPKHNKKQKYVR